MTKRGEVSVPEEAYATAWEAGDSAIDWDNLPAKTRRFFKRQIDAAAPFIAAEAAEEERERLLARDSLARLETVIGAKWNKSAIGWDRLLREVFATLDQETAEDAGDRPSG